MQLNDARHDQQSQTATFAAPVTKRRRGMEQPGTHFRRHPGPSSAILTCTLLLSAASVTTTHPLPARNAAYCRSGWSAQAPADRDRLAPAANRAGHPAAAAVAAPVSCEMLATSSRRCRSCRRNCCHYSRKCCAICPKLCFRIVSSSRSPSRNSVDGSSAGACAGSGSNSNDWMRQVYRRSGRVTQRNSTTPASSPTNAAIASDHSVVRRLALPPMLTANASRSSPTRTT